MVKYILSFMKKTYSMYFSVKHPVQFFSIPAVFIFKFPFAIF